jgi:glycosyltransferase involved in cell wall biosynthesis
MACSVPVVSSNTGGLPEVNIHGVSGYLSNVGDVDDMAANALKILSDDNTLNVFKTNAFETAKQFQIDKIVPKYEEVYQQAINKIKSKKPSV